jgi:hypothetical protein
VKAKKILLPAAALVLFFSCEGSTYGPFFKDIEKEIELEELTVKGNIMSIVEYDGTLYAGGGVIYSKNPGVVGGWSRASSNPDGRVIRLAAGDKLYALTETIVLSDNNSDNDELWYCLWYLNGGSWVKIRESQAAMGLFDNGSAAAYVTYDSKVYSLSGGAVGDEQSGANAQSVSAWGSYFSTYPALCSNGSVIFEGRGSVIYYGNGTSMTAGTDVSNAITCISYCAGDGYLYVGTETGAKKVHVSGGVPGGAEDLGMNADAVLGSYKISAIYAETRPASPTVYAAIVGKSSWQGSKKNGLWASYAGTDSGNWNAE